MPLQKIEIDSNGKHGQCSLATQRGKLFIRLPRKCFGGKQKALPTGLVDTPANRAIAINKLKAIQNDIDLGHFDPTLERYKPQTQKQDYLKSVTTLYPETDLLNLWGQYFEYKKPSLKETTVHYLKTSVEEVRGIGVEVHRIVEHLFGEQDDN